MLSVNIINVNFFKANKMTTFDLDHNSALYQIRAFKPGMIKVNETIFTESIILTPTQLIEHQLPPSADALTNTSFLKIIELKPDILLIGTGSKHLLLSLELYGYLINEKIGVEIMDTAAACRTYNALSAENRNVATVLLIL